MQSESGPDDVEDNWKPPLPDFEYENFEDKCPSKFEYLQVGMPLKTTCIHMQVYKLMKTRN